MSEGSDQSGNLTRQEPEFGLERPRRLTRKQVDYSNSGEGSSRQEIEGEVVVKAEWKRLRECSTEALWGDSASDITERENSCESPSTVGRRTDILIEGVDQLKSQLKQIKMSKREEVSMTELMKMMIDLNAKRDEEVRERDRREKEERVVREKIEKEEQIARERRMEEETRLRMERMKEEAIIREEEREERARIREEKRTEQAMIREEERKAQAEERERKLVLALKETKPIIENVKLPVMEKGTDVESFLELFETALIVAKVPEDKWVARLHAAVDSDTKLLAKDAFVNPTVTYEEAKAALTGQQHMSFSAASEAIMSLDDGKVTKMSIRQGAQRVANCLKKACELAPTWGDTHMYGAVAVMRYYMHPEIKTYLDLKGIEKPEDYFKAVDEWQRTHPGRQVWDMKTKSFGERQPYRQTGINSRRQGECYICRKPGHFAAECRSRVGADRQPFLKQENVTMPLQQPARQDGAKPFRGAPRPVAELTCFQCHQKGHISPNCPTKRKVKKVRILAETIVSLNSNEIFGEVGPHRMPITLDTGAEITVVPVEAVEPHQLTGETKTLRSFNNGESKGQVCTVDISLGGQVFRKQAVTQPGEALGWSVCMCLDLTDPKEREFLTKQITRRAEMSDKEALYVPPVMRDNVLVSGVLVSEAQVVKSVRQKKEVTQQVSVQAEVTETPQQQQVQDSSPEDNENSSVVESGDEEYEDEVVKEDRDVSDGVLVTDEVVDDTSGGRAETEGLIDLNITKIREDMDRKVIADETKADQSLLPLLKLGESDREGYYLSQGVLMRTRTDGMGERIHQVCVPQSQREKCLTAAHSNFGHQGRNKMVALLRPHFYWPNLSKSCRDFVRSCIKCQADDKTLPKPNKMVKRQVTTQPFKEIAIDLVGPFPTATGGYRHLLTCIDTASRWPEAVPLKTTTTRVIIKCLTELFCRNGFPERIISDNGPQFTSNMFKKWLKLKGIAHSKSTPYHPQGNGMVERLHRTLGAVIRKTADSKGNWAKILPLALYFLRCSPSTATGVSPFLLTHGWEPRTPLKALYQSWVQTDLGEIDLGDWILENQERIEAARDKATSTASEAIDKRADRWNDTASDREFLVGEKVWIRRPGLDSKLRQSWIGPCTVVKRNSPVSYAIQTEERRIPTVNVQQMKLVHSQDKIRRVTSMLEEDSQSDDLMNTFAEAKIQEQQLKSTQTRQLNTVLETYKEVLSKEPGTTSLVKFDIDTGKADPIYQHPYNIPMTMKAKVDKELDWLLERKFIRPSSSPWASPMVTVKKPDGSARLCVDFRKINGLTRQTPFYMPRVEEVLEGVGRAHFISKLDLSKGYYQVQLAEQAIPKTAFISHRGVFEFTRMPFGVRNAPACFQELMQQVLKEQRQWATAYMDDVVVYSNTWEEHLDHISRVLQALRQAGLTANPEKCRWGGRAIEFLGHWIGGGNMTIPSHKIEVLQNYNKPVTKRGLRAFIGTVSFYRRYIQQLAKYTAILTPMTAKQAPQKLDWTAEGEEAFRYICNFFCNIPVLCIPEVQDIVSIVTDASGRGIGGVLQVERDGDWQPAAYYSRQLRGAENRYSATELEALALVETVAHFGHYLYGKSFKAFTDHKPLEQLVTSTRLNPRLARMSFKLQHWLINIIYLPGVLNTLADALSREEGSRRLLQEDQESELSREEEEEQQTEQIPEQEQQTVQIPEGEVSRDRIQENVEDPRHSSSVGGCGGNTSTRSIEESKQ